MGRDSLNRIVKDVLLQDENVRENYENSLSKIKRLSKSIPTSVAALYQIKQEIEDIEEKIRQLGEEKSIESTLPNYRRTPMA